MTSYLNLIDKLGKTNFPKDLYVEIRTCLMYMSKNEGYLLADPGKINGANVRTITCSPIVMMICVLHGY